MAKFRLPWVSFSEPGYPVLSVGRKIGGVWFAKASSPAWRSDGSWDPGPLKTPPVPGWRSQGFCRAWTGRAICAWPNFDTIQRVQKPLGKTFALKKVVRDSKRRCCIHLYIGQQWLSACQALKAQGWDVHSMQGNKVPAGHSNLVGLDAWAPLAAAGRPSLGACPVQGRRRFAHPISSSKLATQHTLAGARCQSITLPSAMLLVESPRKCPQEDLIWIWSVVWKEKSWSSPLSALRLPPHRGLRLWERDSLHVQIQRLFHYLSGPRSDQN